MQSSPCRIIDWRVLHVCCSGGYSVFEWHDGDAGGGVNVGSFYGIGVVSYSREFFTLV